MTDRSLYRPSLEEFRELCATHTVVPVFREVLADMLTPVAALRKLAHSRHYFLLESAEHGRRWARFSFIGIDPFAVLKSTGAEVTWEGEPPSWAHGDDPLSVAESAINGFRAPKLDGLPPLHGGAVGYLGYDTVRHIEKLPTTAGGGLPIPEMQLQFTDRLVAFDHYRQVISVIANVRPTNNAEADYDDAVRRCEELVAYLSQPLDEPTVAPPPVVRQDPPPSNVSLDRFKEMLSEAHQYILAGDIFQVVLSQRFELSGLRCSPLDIYRMLRLVNPSPYMYLLRFDDTWIVGSSPEALVRVENGVAVTHPIAGTRWRGETAAKDQELENELLTDDKERAEHIMLVDLARNDLGRVCDYSSVCVTRLMEVERYSHLMHLVSEVTGNLREGISAFDVFRATFPAGTVSGAPKVRAMEIIEELESVRRGVYGGVVGYFDFSGNLDTAIALRTAVIKDSTAYVQAGGGIVADSKPEDEYLESINKASALLNAIRSAEALAD